MNQRLNVTRVLLVIFVLLFLVSCGISEIEPAPYTPSDTIKPAEATEIFTPDQQITSPTPDQQIATPTPDQQAMLPTEIPSADVEAIREIVRTAGQQPVPPEEKHQITEGESYEEGDYRYTEEKHDVVDNIDNITYLGLNDDIIWPGNLVRGDRANDFVYEPIAVDRAPITLSISLEGSPAVGSSITHRVDDPKLSTVRQGISDLLKTAITEDTHVPAKVEFEYQEVYNESQMNLFVGADVSYGAGSISTGFNWDSTSKKTKIMAKYKQVYYSIDIDPPTHPADFLSPSITTPEVATAMPIGSRPLYIASVSYGMMAYMYIETDFEAETMMMALDAAYKGLVDVKVKFDYTAEDILRSSSIKIVVYGGSTAGLQDLETDFDGFKKIIDASRNYGTDSPGVPLIYKFRHLYDNTLALVTLTSQYTLVRPLQLIQRVRVTVDSFNCTKSDDEGYDNDADMDRFSVSASAYNRILESESGSPIIENKSVYNWATPGEVTMGRGYVWLAKGQNSIDIAFNTEYYNFNLARLVIVGYAREYDRSSANESATNTYEVQGNMFFENGGQHIFTLDSADFGFDVFITIEALN